MKYWRIKPIKGIGLGFLLARDCDGALFFVLTVGPFVLEYDSAEAFFVD